LRSRNDRGKIALEHMTIRYNNGFQQEAILLSRTESAIRVAILGSDDVAEFRARAEHWISEDCEAVEIEFFPARHHADQAPALDECLCSTELASYLVDKLFSGDGEPKAGTFLPSPCELPARLPLM
jgi:hypothetical protein